MRVVDTSIALKWYATEPDSERADRLLGTGLIAPDLMIAELGNALWKKVRKSELSATQAQAALGGLGVAVSLVPALPFALRAFEMSIELDHPIYDCFSLALAEHQRTRLITADRRLITRCAASPYADLLFHLDQQDDEYE